VCRSCRHPATPQTMGGQHARVYTVDGLIVVDLTIPSSSTVTVSMPFSMTLQSPAPSTSSTRHPDDIWTDRILTVKFPGDIWTVKTGLGLGFLFGFGLGLGLVMTVQFMTVKIETRWRGGATGKAFRLAISRSRVQILLEATLRNNLRQGVYTYVPLSPSSITWYRPKGGDALRLGR